MKSFQVPGKTEVSTDNQAIFDQLDKKLGFVPNLYAFYAKSETALADYLALQSRKSSLTAKEREVINLVVSEVNGCRYCQSAHTLLGKMNGFIEEQILELRSGTIKDQPRLNALAAFTKEVVIKRGKAGDEALSIFFKEGYNEAQMIDVLMVVGDKTISNYLHNIAQFAIDFPEAPVLEQALA